MEKTSQVDILMRDKSEPVSQTGSLSVAQG
jgi:hypothetical protein